MEHDISFFLLPNAAAQVDGNCSVLELLAYLKKKYITLAKDELSFSAKA
jgi:hypothetical protein